jgi:hypothetical protein
LSLLLVYLKYLLFFILLFPVLFIIKQMRNKKIFNWINQAFKIRPQSLLTNELLKY